MVTSLKDNFKNSTKTREQQGSKSSLNKSGKMVQSLLQISVVSICPII
jgi:hypothetical protein